MSTYERDIARIEAMVEDIRAIRARTCEPKNQSNPRYHALSMAVSGLMKAAVSLSGPLTDTSAGSPRGRR